MSEQEPQTGKERLWFPGDNPAEELAEVIIENPVSIVNATRIDAPDDNSIIGGFVDHNLDEVQGTGQTVIRENGEETGRDIRRNQLIKLADHEFCADPRNSKERWITTTAFLVTEVRRKKLDLKTSEEAKKIEQVTLNSEYLNGKFYAQHDRTVRQAIDYLEKRLGMKIDGEGRLKMPESLYGLNTDNFEAASYEIAGKMALSWENTSPMQLQRIWKKVDNNIDALGLEVAKRELLVDELLRAENPLTEFLSDFKNYSKLFESMADGAQGKFGRFVNAQAPLLGLLSRAETSTNKLSSQDYQKSEAGLPGYDWQLFDKAIIRMSENLNKISPDFGDPKTNAAFILTALHLDVSKGGTHAERSSWKDINPYVHNVASAELVRRSGILEEILGDKDSAQLFEKLIEYHGLMGQYVRGEVTEHVFEGLTDWVKEKGGKIKDFDAGKIAEMFYLINVLDIKSVRDDLFTDKIDKEFTRLKNCVKMAIEGNYRWGEDTEKITDVNKKREFLADRITRLRGGNDHEEVLGTLLELPESQVNYIFDLLGHAQFWYVENATANFSVESQLKLLVLSSRLAREKSNDKYGNFDVNFAPLMNTIKPEGKLNRALSRTLDSMLYKLSWSETLDIPYKNEISADANLKINILEESGILGIDCLLSEEMADACNLINLGYAEGKTDSPEFKIALDSLTKWTGIKLDEWDRVFDQETYMATMNSSMIQKTESVRTAIEEAKKSGKKIIYVGIGSGTGELEHAITKMLGSQDLVIGTDISRAMVENMKRISRILAAEKYLHPDREIAQMRTVLADASNVSKEALGISDEDAVVIFGTHSVFHEFASYVDGFKTGEFTKEVYTNLLKGLKVGDEISLRDFEEAQNPNEKIKVKIGKNKAGDEVPVSFIREFTKEFSGFTRKERDEISGFPENLAEGMEIGMSKHLAMEIMGHYSWLKSHKNTKEKKERYGYFSERGYKNWFNKLANRLGIELEIEFESKSGEYEKFISEELDAYDLKGNKIPVPLNMVSIVIHRVK